MNNITPATDPGTVYIVLTLNPDDGVVIDCEVLDQMPQWDWMAAHQVVRCGSLNGGDSVVVPMPPANRSGHTQ
jgi:hypothetical protein